MMPIVKNSSGRDVKNGAPAPSSDSSPQDQKGMNGSNASPANTRRGMPVSKPSSGRSVSMPKYLPQSGKKEAPPANRGGVVGPSRAGESAQPLTAPVVPGVEGGTPSSNGFVSDATPQNMGVINTVDDMSMQGGETEFEYADSHDVTNPDMAEQLFRALQQEAPLPNEDLNMGSISDMIRQVMQAKTASAGNMQNPQNHMQAPQFNLM